MVQLGVATAEKPSRSIAKLQITVTTIFS
jgi:hypothetical protein